MNKKCLIKELKECNGLGPEEGHLMADQLLLVFIGDPEVTAAFTAISKWYA
jgi:hypothetical protein